MKNFKLEKEVIKSIKNFLFDCDGVIWKQNTLIPGSKDLLEILKKNGKRVFLISNNSTISVENYVKKCEKLGLQIEPEEIVCSANILARYMKSKNVQGKAYIVGEEGISTELNKVGIANFGVGEDNRPFRSLAEDDNLLDDEVQSVVVGFDSHFNLTKMMIATSYILQKKCMFFATNTDVVFPTVKYCIPGTGSMVQAIATASSTEPIVTGKPHSHMFTILKEQFGLNANESIMIGDNLDTDIKFGNDHHMRTLLVLTGVTSKDILMKVDPASSPTYVTDSVADLISIFK